MKKLLLTLLFFSFATLLNAQHISDIQESSSDTLSVSVINLLNPSNNFDDLASSGNYNNFAITSDHLKLNSSTKFLLKLGTGILRGTQTNWQNDNIPLYSHENTWKYPGKTIRYPESLVEYKGFLERYSDYTLDN